MNVMSMFHLLGGMSFQEGSLASYSEITFELLLTMVLDDDDVSENKFYKDENTDSL